MSHGDLLVEGKDLVLGYRSRGKTHRVVEGLDFSVRAGQLVCLIGPNGAGKSTLLKALSGSLEPLDGHLSVCGTRPARMRPSQLAASMALVLNERPANTGIKVDELVGLGRLPHTGAFGRFAPADHSAVEEAMRETEIVHLRDRSFGELSDGERARVQVARALAQDTPLLLLDEPTAHLDWPHRIALATLLLRLARECDKGILLSTHELDLALQVADQWILLAPDCPPVCAAPEQIALEGCFKRAFGEKGFHLDSSFGQIRLDRSTSRPVRLTGDGDGREWTERALERMGWRIDPFEGPEVSVSVSGTGASWIAGGVRHDRLESMLHALHALASHESATVQPVDAAP